MHRAALRTNLCSGLGHGLGHGIGLRSYGRASEFRQSTITDITAKYNAGEPISFITAHDAITGAIADSASGIDAILVGDSMAMTSRGYESTLQLPYDEYRSSCEAVTRGVAQKLIVADMPFGSVEKSDEACIESAVDIMKMGKIGAVKIEGGVEMAPRIGKLIRYGIPVMGHIGLQPQKFNAVGGYKVQGKTAESAVQVYRDALALQDAGCSMMVLECVPHKVATWITDRLSVPTIGIGSGHGCSGQVLVFADLLGMIDTKHGKFVRQYMNFFQDATAALDAYSADVKQRSFPENQPEGFKIKDEEFDRFLQLAEKA